jgi:copper resistance protein C
VRRVSVTLVGFLATVSLALAPLGFAWGHAEMVKSSPMNGAAVKQAPAAIQATFSEELAKGSIMRLYDGHQKLLASGGLDSSVASHRVLKIVAPHLAPGGYVVQWVAISADDGNTHKGSFRFSVGTTAMAPAGAMTSPPPLHLIAPASRAQLKNPVVLLLETTGDMSKLTMGKSMAPMSGMGSMGPQVHLHIAVDGKMFMPATDQLKKVGPSRYEYAVPGTLAAGTHTIKVFWADDKTHETAGAAQTVTFTVVG